MVVLHIAFIILTGLAVLYSDEQGFMWIMGKKRTLDPRRVDTLHIMVSVGLSAIIATGGLLFIRDVPYYLHEPVFLTKMIFVGALILNGLFIDRLSVTATTRPFAKLTSRERLPLLVSGAVSVGGWIGAGLCGLLLG